MTTPVNMDLYNKLKQEIFMKNPINSAYRSGLLIKSYKDAGGTFKGEKPKTGLTRWFKENWKDIGRQEYPVYRPTKRISKDTPLTVKEIDPQDLKKKIKQKQKIKSDTLPKFKKKS
jgi:hypothetical protein